jgi:NADPH:quinone reductase-like Zn-dependent oxidoreductase
MKAIILKEYGTSENFQLNEVDLPKPGQNQVRIKIDTISFNPVDFKMRRGDYGKEKKNLILGIDCAGVIDSVGEGVSDFRPGDRVVAFVFGQGSNGTYAEYTCIHSHFVAKIPQELSFEQAACLPVAGLSAYRAILPSHQKGAAIFIAGGTGGVGSLAIQLAQEFKMGPIFTTAGSEESAEYLIDILKVKREWILFYKGLSFDELLSQLLKKNGGKLIPFAFDFVGGEMKKLCFACADFQGHVISILPEKRGFPFDFWERGESVAFQKSLTTRMLFVGAEALAGGADKWKEYQKQLGELAQLAAAKKIGFSKLTRLKGLNLENIRKAHQMLEIGHTHGKITLTIH